MTDVNGNNRNPQNYPADHSEIIKMIKAGNMSVPESLSVKQKEAYPHDFIRFMDQMLDEKHMKKKMIAARTGLSEDYTYKILNGQKKAGDRDYIIAICLALGLSLAQIQHALSCYGMPLLSRKDSRANLIMMGIEGGRDIHAINNALHNQGFPYIRVSPDMPKAEIRDSTYIDEQLLASVKDQSEGSPRESNAPELKKSIHTYEEIESHAKAEPAGIAPIDYNYIGYMTLQDEEDNRHYLEAAFLASGEVFLLVMNEAQHQKRLVTEQELNIFDEDPDDFTEMDPSPSPSLPHVPDTAEKTTSKKEELKDILGNDFEECYESLLDATVSEFFCYFMELDELTDQKVIEQLQKFNDTRNYGHRVGYRCSGGDGPLAFIELFNQQQPELREYYQIIEKQNGECTYTASHESYYLRYEMGEMYDLYYPIKREPEYFLEATDQTYNQLTKRYQIIFNLARHLLHEFVLSNNLNPDFDMKKHTMDEIEFFSEQAMIADQREEYSNEKKYLQEAGRLIKNSHLPEPGKFRLQMINDWKKYNLACQTEDKKTIKQIEKNILKAEDQLQLYWEEIENISDLYSVIAQVLLAKLYRCEKEEEHETKIALYEKILNMVENQNALVGEDYCVRLFFFYTHYAYDIDSENPERAEIYYKKALRLATLYHLDSYPDTAAAVANTYNNLAWVLWNKLNSEEAIIHYGRAIELGESYLDNGIIPHDKTVRLLKHYGDALLRIYKETSRENEYQKLVKRLKRSGVYE